MLQHTYGARGPVKQGLGVIRGMSHGVIVVVHFEARDDPVPRRIGIAPIACPAALACVIVGARRNRDHVFHVSAAERRVVVDLYFRRAKFVAYVGDVVALADVYREVRKSGYHGRKAEYNLYEVAHCRGPGCKSKGM